eukprot:scaffold11682_cov19-Tisochrysis_lutea.AAC.1
MGHPMPESLCACVWQTSTVTITGLLITIVNIEISAAVLGSTIQVQHWHYKQRAHRERSAVAVRRTQQCGRSMEEHADHQKRMKQAAKVKLKEKAGHMAGHMIQAKGARSLTQKVWLKYRWPGAKQLQNYAMPLHA